MKKIEKGINEIVNIYKDGNEDAKKFIIGYKSKYRPVQELEFYTGGFTTMGELIAYISDKVSYFRVGNQKWETGDKFRSLLYIKSYDLMKVVYI